MFRTLRSRLILSHVIPLVLIIPLIGVGLIYLLERQFLIPQFAQNLIGDANLLVEISRAEYELFGNPVLSERVLNRVKLDPNIKVMFFNSRGELLYSSNPDDLSFLGSVLDLPGLDQARAGEQIALTNYSLFKQNDVLVDVFTPVLNPTNRVIGIVRVSYQVASVYDLFVRFRFLVAVVLLLGLLLSVLLGSLLAVSIGRPIQEVTRAINDLATGQRYEPLMEKGPDDLRRQVRAVNFLVEQLHSLEQARRQLLANLVHELGRPLGALRSAIQALAQGAAKDPLLFDDLTQGMDEEAGRLQHVVDDLAHLYDQVLGDLELNRKEVRLNEWLLSVLRTWQTAAQEKKLEWVVEIPDDIPVVQIDPFRLGQVIGNLASNAVKYTAAGGLVSITAGAEGNEVWIRVLDSGAGIPFEEQEKIFEPFYRGDYGKRVKQGMGLGLSIARDLVAAHGGRIELQSEPGRGSQFTLWLPLS